MRLALGTSWRHPALWQYVTIAFPLMLGQSIVVLDETFMSVFGDLVGDGAQTQLQYARRTMLVPVGVIAQAAAVAAYPFLARLHAEDRQGELADTVDTALKYVVAASIAASALLAALSAPVIRALFERGPFEATDTTASAEALFFYAFSVPIWGILQVLTRAFYARRQMWTPVVVGTAATVAAVPIYLLLQRTFGIRGVALASTLVLGLYTLALAVLWYREPAHRGRIAAIVDVGGRAIPPTVIGGLAAFVVGWGVTELLGVGFIPAVLATISGLAAFAATALVLAAGLYSIVGPGEPDAAADDTDRVDA